MKEKQSRKRNEHLGPVANNDRPRSGQRSRGGGGKNVATSRDYDSRQLLDNSSRSETTSRFAYDNQGNDGEESFDSGQTRSSRLEILNVTKNHTRTETDSESDDQDVHGEPSPQSL